MESISCHQENISDLINALIWTETWTEILL